MFMEGEMGVLCKNNEFKVPKVPNVLWSLELINFSIIWKTYKFQLQLIKG